MTKAKNRNTELAVTTIGYEKAALSDFVSTLVEQGVSVLLDVREMPISRRRGFSKSALSQAVRDAGIEYQHERRLGSPSQIRKRLKADGNYARFFRDFAKYLVEQQDLLTSLANNLSGKVALMCYERNQEECHRTLVAEALGRLVGTEPEHLKVSTGRLADGEAKDPRVHIGQGISPA